MKTVYRKILKPIEVLYGNAKEPTVYPEGKYILCLPGLDKPEGKMVALDIGIVSLVESDYLSDELYEDENLTWSEKI